MKRTTGYTAAILALGIAFCSCQRVLEPQELVPNGEDLIAFESQIGEVALARSGAVSKAVAPMHSKTAFADGDQMGLFLSLNSGKLLMRDNTHAKFSYDNLLYTQTAGKFTTAVGSPAGTIYYPYRTTKVDLWGIHPYDANAASYSADAYPWSVAADQTTNALVVASDFLSAVTRGVVPNNTGVAVNLNFKHRMTQLKLAIAFPTEVDGKKLDPTTPIAEIYIENLKIEGAVDLNQETVAPKTGATAQEMKPYYLGFSKPAEPADERAMDLIYYQAIVVPQTVAAGTNQLVRLVVNYVGGTQGLFLMPVDTDVTFESGTMHTLSLSFDTQNRLRLEASGKIPWNKNTDYNTASNVWQGDNQTITVGNTVWAKGFLTADGTGKGCRIGYAKERGTFFQFGSLVGWNDLRVAVVKPSSVTTPAWNSNYYTTGTAGELFTILPQDNPSGNGTGDACRFYLGSSWRMPTSAELFALTGSAAVTSINWGTAGLTASYDSSIPGAWFGENFAAKDTLTVPLFYQSGNLTTAGVYSAAGGQIHSATLGATVAQTHSLKFTTTQLTRVATEDRKVGGAIRCVWIRNIYELSNPAMSGTTPTQLRFGFNFASTWVIAGKPAWLNLSATTGTATIGEASFAITMTPTAATATARTATLTITATDTNTKTVESQTITVTQNP